MMVISCSSVSMYKMRIGFSEDIHELVENRPLILGGVIIPSDNGEKAHSDGDVLLHAISESILGALALGDLGTFFPDDKDETLNMDSKFILAKVKDLMKKEGYEIGNVDASIILEKPKLKEYIPLMRKNIAEILDTDIKNISIKAGTNEKMDSIGEGKAIKATSIVLLKK